jgi:putative ABC transport system substrate-binding protein
MNTSSRRIAAALCALAALWSATTPLSAQTRPARKTPLVAYLSLARAAPPAVFVSRFGELGYVDKQNVAIEYRFGEGRHEAMDGIARELVGLDPDVILAVGDEAIVATRKATTTIPIVMLACDALALGFVKNLSKPDGNLTGVSCLTAELSSKRVGLLKEAMPKALRVGLMFNPANLSMPLNAKQTKSAALGLGLKIVETREVLEQPDFEQAFAAFASNHADAVIVLDEAFTLMHAKRTAELEVKHRLPTMHSWGDAVVAGGLMSYGPNLADMLRTATDYVDKILKGTKPANLPVAQPTKFELVVNLKTAKALGITIPQSILARADQVIE